MKSNVIKVLVKEPGKPARMTTVGNNLESLQKLVDGYIETVTFAENLVIICDEEGWLKDKPFNIRMGGLQFFGTIVLASTDGDEFSSLKARTHHLRILFPALFEKVGEYV